MSVGFSLPDLFDANEGILVAATPLFRSFGGSDAFYGQIRTIKCHEDNSLVAERLREASDGAVLVVDGGASLRCALLGDNLAAIAADNGWAGILINGCVRDLPELAATALGIVALASHPQRSIKQGVGQQDLVVRFAGLTFAPDAWLYADLNGVGVSPVELSLSV
jgi:regulator of ribonuclease activity A